MWQRGGEEDQLGFGVLMIMADVAGGQSSVNVALGMSMLNIALVSMYVLHKAQLLWSTAEGPTTKIN